MLLCYQKRYGNDNWIIMINAIIEGVGVVCTEITLSLNVQFIFN